MDFWPISPGHVGWVNIAQNKRCKAGWGVGQLQRRFGGLGNCKAGWGVGQLQRRLGGLYNCKVGCGGSITAKQRGSVEGWTTAKQLGGGWTTAKQVGEG